ncbi:MAG: hypothetical protein M3487_00090, partial [Actinomycetota bacterium]|nr:hypothetical protein [Actinomycetota bacterium]
TDEGSGTVYTANFNDIRVDSNSMVLVIAFIPDSEDPRDIQMPPWAAQLPELGAADTPPADIGPDGSTPASATDGSAPTDSAGTSPASTTGDTTEGTDAATTVATTQTVPTATG